jgi:hypothetical protein
LILTSFLSFRKMVSRLEQITICAFQMTIWKVYLGHALDSHEQSSSDLSVVTDPFSQEITSLC